MEAIFKTDENNFNLVSHEEIEIGERFDWAKKLNYEVTEILEQRQEKTKPEFVGKKRIFARVKSISVK